MVSQLIYYCTAGYMSKDWLRPEDHVGTPLDGVLVSIVDPRNGLLFHIIEFNDKNLNLKISFQSPFNELQIIRWIASFGTYFGSEFSLSLCAVKMLSWPKARIFFASSNILVGKSCLELATLNKEAIPSVCSRTGQEVEVGSRGEICIRKEDMVTHTYIGDHQVGKITIFLYFTDLWHQWQT